MTRTLLLSILVMTAVAGCSLQRAAQPLPETPFLPKNDSGQGARSSAFEEVWVDPNFSPKPYDEVYIAPVNLDYLPQDAWRSSAEFGIHNESGYRQAVEQLAKYMQQSFRDRFTKSEDNRFRVVDRPGPRTLTVETALIEAVFQRPVGYLAALAAPLPGTAQVFDVLSSPSLAFALRVRTPEGRIVAAVADREFPAIRPIDLKKLSASAPAREVVDRWARMIVDAFNERSIRKPARFSLLPW